LPAAPFPLPRFTHANTPVLPNPTSPTGDAAQVSRCCWLAARVIIYSKSDPDVRGALIELTGQHGLMGPRTPPGVAAAAWARLWLDCSNLEREALAALLQARQAVQVRGWCGGEGPGTCRRAGVV
jgi:hypothetical protein